MSLIVLILKEEEERVYPVCSVGSWLRGNRKKVEEGCFFGIWRR